MAEGEARQGVYLKILVALSWAFAALTFGCSQSPSLTDGGVDGGTDGGTDGGMDAGTDGGPDASVILSTIGPAQLAALEAIVSDGQASLRSDTETARVAAQLTRLEHDRATALATANLLDIAAKDPKFSATATQLQSYRARELARAADDATQIATVLSTTTVSGKAALAADGGAGRAISAIVAQSFAAQAQVFLAAGAEARKQGTAGPSPDEIAIFLQEEAIVLGDEEQGGHDVAGRAVATALLAGMSVATLTSADGGGQ